MANNLPMIRKAFLTTRSISSGTFLLTERFEHENGNALFYIIESDNEKSAKNLQRNLQNELVKQFMTATKFDIIDFESSLHFINKKMLACEGQFSGLSSLAGLLDENTLHLSMIGEIEGYLLRKSKINSLTEGLGNDEEDPGFYNITSGQLALGDLVIIGNKKIFNRLSLDRIRRTLSQFSPREAIRDFYQILRKSKDLECNAIVMQAVSPLASEKDDEKLPDLLYLDEIVETAFQKFLKQAKPVASSAYSRTQDLASKAFTISKDLASKSGSTIKEKYTPQTKKILSQTNTKAIEGFSKISSNLKNRNGIKIKPYSKRSASGQPLWVSNISKITSSIIDKKNRRYLYMALVFILIFGAYMKIRSNNQNREQVKKLNDATYSYDQANDTFAKAREDIGLGRNDGTAKLEEALNQAEVAKGSPASHDKAIALYKEIQQKIDDIAKMHRVYDPKPIFSFKYDVAASAVSGSTIYAATSDGKIYLSDTREKNPKLIAAIPPELGKPINATYADSMNLIMFLTDASKIWGYDEQTQSGAELSVDGNKWEAANALAAYSSNLYLLEPSTGKVWRHSKNGSSFTSGKAYAGAKNADSKDGLSIAIDGAIFVLKQGQVIKFSHNIPDTSFVLQMPPKPDDNINGAKEVYTDADSQHILILDSAKNRIIRYAKDGQFTSQYAIDQVTVNQMLYNPRVQKMWLIAGKDVYEIDL